MNESEKKVFNHFLNQASEAMSNAGCNDLVLENTPENREMVIEATKAGMGSDGEELAEEFKLEYEEVDIFGKPVRKNITTMDTLVFDYLVKKMGFKPERLKGN